MKGRRMQSLYRPAPFTSQPQKWRVFIFIFFQPSVGASCGSVVKNPPANAGDESWIPGSGRFSWRRKWQSTLIFLSGEFQGQRNLVGYSPQCRKESNMAEHAHMQFLFSGSSLVLCGRQGSLSFLQIRDAHRLGCGSVPPVRSSVVLGQK